MDYDVHRPLIAKVLLRFLHQHHRESGLIVVAWARPVAGYFSFMSLAIPLCDGHPVHPTRLMHYALNLYQDHISMPAWAGTRKQPKLSAGRVLNLDELHAWFRRRLEIGKLLTEFAGEIVEWRRSYTDAEAEAYLLTWEVMGAIASQRRFLHTYGMSEYGDGDVPDGAEERLCGRHPCQGLHCVDQTGLWFVDTGWARLPSGDWIDLRNLFAAGQLADEVAAHLLTEAQRWFA
jgi:hypothetical protein